MSPGRERDGYLELPGGPSGHPLSPFYRSGFEDWANGVPTPFLPGTAAAPAHAQALMSRCRRKCWRSRSCRMLRSCSSTRGSATMKHNVSDLGELEREVLHLVWDHGAFDRGLGSEGAVAPAQGVHRPHGAQAARGEGPSHAQRRQPHLRLQSRGHARPRRRACRKAHRRSLLQRFGGGGARRTGRCAHRRQRRAAATGGQDRACAKGGRNDARDPGRTPPCACCCSARPRGSRCASFACAIRTSRRSSGEWCCSRGWRCRRCCTGASRRVSRPRSSFPRSWQAARRRARIRCRSPVSLLRRAIVPIAIYLGVALLLLGAIGRRARRACGASAARPCR